MLLRGLSLSFSARQLARASRTWGQPLIISGPHVADRGIQREQIEFVLVHGFGQQSIELLHAIFADRFHEFRTVGEIRVNFRGWI